MQLAPARPAQHAWPRARRDRPSCSRMAVITGAAAAVICGLGSPAGSGTQSAAEFQPIAEEAYLYGFPMIVAYHVLYDYNVDRTSGAFRAPFNEIASEARVYTPKDTAVSTPNSDTPYSFVQLDLRAEPMVLCVPDIDPGRYYDVQLTDLYTNNIGYMGSRTTGNGAGCALVAGPGWSGETPQGVGRVFRSDTDFTFTIFRTSFSLRRTCRMPRRSRRAIPPGRSRPFSTGSRRPQRPQSTGPRPDRRIFSPATYLSPEFHQRPMLSPNLLIYWTTIWTPNPKPSIIVPLRPGQSRR